MLFWKVYSIIPGPVLHLGDTLYLKIVAQKHQSNITNSLKGLGHSLMRVSLSNSVQL